MLRAIVRVWPATLSCPLTGTMTPAIMPMLAFQLYAAASATLNEQSQAG